MIGVLRLSSLGDVVLASSVTGPLGQVAFITQPRFHGLVERFQGVQRVLGPEDRAALSRVVDLQSSPRSRAICAGLRAPVRRVEMHRLARWSRVAWKRPERIPRVIDRYARAAGVELAPLPWIEVSGSRERVTLVPGAAHATKRWPLEHWIRLGRGLDRPLVLGGPGEEALVEELAVAVRGEALVERGFERTLAALGGSRLVVAGDTGLLHLAAACGVPVLGLFGATTSADGFWSHPGQALELDLACRPCSRHGGPICPMGDLACLTLLKPDRVLEAIASGG